MARMARGDAKLPVATWLALTVVVATVTTALAGSGAPAAGQEVATPSASSASASSLEPITLPELEAPASIVWDEVGVPQITARNARDAAFLLGRAHVRDRFFQMDFWRRYFSGTLAELLGESALSSDRQARQDGFRRAAEATWPALPEPARTWLKAYAAGVNQMLGEHPLPVEHRRLGIDPPAGERALWVPPWTPIDSLTLLKGLLALQLHRNDLRFTVDLDDYQRAGDAQGFDGTALFFEDIYRADAPVAAVTHRAGLAELSHLPSSLPDVPPLHEILRPETLDLARELIGRAPAPPPAGAGSNWWAISGRHTASGHPILAGDPHLLPTSPPIFYEARLRILGEGGEIASEISGMGFAGVPGVAAGCTLHACWSAAILPVDAVDLFEEELLLDPQSGLPVELAVPVGSSAQRGEALEHLEQVYRVRRPKAGADGEDVLETVEVPATDGGVVIRVPSRDHAVLLGWKKTRPGRGVGLSLAYTGAGPTLEAEALRRFQAVDGVESFAEALAFFDLGALTWGVASVDGTIAMLTSGELPLRRDLEQEGRFDSVPPFLIRVGARPSHGWMRTSEAAASQRPAHRSLSGAILPFEEMPQAIDPVTGVLASSNNDPLGLVDDNDPFNHLRTTGGVFYLDRSYDGGGLRGGRLEHLLGEALAEGGKLTLEQARAIQSDHQMLDAELVVPHLARALERARSAEAAPRLAMLVENPRLVEAVERLAAWDGQGSTGLRSGYDPGDHPENLAEPTVEEVRASVAATLFAVLRSRLIDRVIDQTLARHGLIGPQNYPAWTSTLRRIMAFEKDSGIGSSGIDFFAVPGVEDRAAARDLVLLESLRDGLAMLSSEPFAALFGPAPELDAYRWGLLHRVVLAHPLAAAGIGTSLPPGGGFAAAAPGLPGVARAGGWGVLDQSIHRSRAKKPEDFRAVFVASARLLNLLDPEGIVSQRILPGGQSGDPESPHFADQFGRWLSNGYRTMRLGAPPRGEVELFVPATD